ncbi:MAG: glycosyl hydrolase family 95 catalytic domain-containing protein, partial [Eubacteriales bacterium]
MNTYILHLANEAKEWENTIPVGCGRLGACLYGGVGEERLQLNEEKIWSGGPMEVDGDGFRDKIEEIRSCLRAGKNADACAEEILEPYFKRICSYETAGDLFLTMQNAQGEVRDYRRDLDLNNGITAVSYRLGDTLYNRTLFASYPKQVIAMRLTADHPGRISFTADYRREANIEVTAAPQAGNTADMHISGTTVIGNHRFSGILRFVPDGGSISCGDAGTVTVEHADSVCVYIALRTEDEALLPEIGSFDALLTEHRADFSAIMNRADIAYDYDEALDAIPVNERLARVRNGETDAGLVNLYFQFGRYLLLSSSRGSSLPANLQGVWSPYLEAPWNADYHTNINLQMNYWHAESANLPECAVPLFSYINNYLLPGGKKVAEAFYHCRGTVLHHLSDIYGFAMPADGLWGLWPMGGAWLCYALWEHYLYQPDDAFLRTEAYPYIE